MYIVVMKTTKMKPANILLGKKAYFYNFGCRLNQYESNALESGFIDNKIKITSKADNADYIIINTCTVTNRADQKNRSLIRKVHKDNPNAKIVVTGCYATTDSKDISAFKEVDYIIPNQHKTNLLNILEGNKDYKPNFFDYNYKTKTGMARAYLKIQDGCNKACSYCKIPQARGKAQSKNFYDVIEEASTLIEMGYH